jgi:hypothetical protein
MISNAFQKFPNLKREQVTIIAAGLILLLFGMVVYGYGYAAAMSPSAVLQVSEKEAIPHPPDIREILLQNQITQTFPAAKDSFISTLSMNSNYGSAPTLVVERTYIQPVYFNKYSLIGFDLTSLPLNAVIDSAVLQVYSEINHQSAEPDTITIMPDAVLEPWEEMTVTWATRPAQQHLGDPGTGYSPGWHNFDVYHIVNAWQAGELDNNGISLRLSSTELGTAVFHSRDSGTPAYPRLVVTYHTEGSPALLPAIEDTYINQYNPAMNYGNAAWLRVTNGNYTLIKFDVSDLPENIVPTSAKLWLYSEINRGGGQDLSLDSQNDIHPYLITSPWNEMEVTWNSNVQAVYLDDPPRSYSTGWIDVDVTNIVFHWLDGSYTNNGIQLRLGSSGTALWDFFTRSGQYGPRLEIFYENATPPCIPVTQVLLSGPVSGLTNKSYDFTAVIVPPDATLPLTYTFTASEQGSSSGSSNSTIYGWSTIGAKTVSASVENCGGLVEVQRQVAISTPPTQCPNPLLGLSISGPGEGLVGMNQNFYSVFNPGNPTLPAAFAWQATGQDEAFNTQNAAYSWTESGDKIITHQASNCGGSFENYKVFRSLQPSQLADLRVSNAWYEPDQDRIGYLIQNIGGSSAPAGFQIEIYRGSTELGSSVFSVTIPAGAVRAGYTNVSWNCAGGTDVLEVRADALNQIEEGDESNNSLFETWPCDLTPPVLLNGPSVSSITETTATISWVTDDATSTRLTYGWSTSAGQIIELAAYRNTHTINLTGLSAGMTYFFDIQSTNANGQILVVTRKYFQTKPIGSDPPVIMGANLEKYPHSDYEFYSIKADISRPEQTQRVEFYWDGQLLGTDYNYGDGFQFHFSPHHKGWTRVQFFKYHNLLVRAYNWHGTSTDYTKNIIPPSVDRPIIIQLLSPGDDYVIYYPGASVPSGKTYDAKVSAYHTEWKCTASGHSTGNPGGLPGIPCDGMMQKVAQVKMVLHKGGAYVSEKSIAPAGVTISIGSDVSGQEQGVFTARITAFYGGRSVETSQNFVIQWGAPPLEVDRTITREGNIFTIQLTITNPSDVTVRLKKITDSMVGFQPVGYGNSQGYNLVPKSYFSGDVLVAIPELLVDKTLSPGGSFSLSYEVVPVLYETPKDPKIGQVKLNIDLADGSTRAVSSLADLVNDPSYTDPVPLAAAYINASRTADYILVTNPWRVNHHYGVNFSTDIQKTYSSMAELASLKNGVLGFLKTNDKALLDWLLTPGSYWTEMLNPVFKEIDKGYVLLVGETEVIPAYHEGTSNFTTYAGIPDWVPISDLRYADTSGNTARPELVLGRIIGNNPKLWLQTLDRTISVYTGERSWDGSSAQPVSGRGDFVTSNLIPTIKIVDRVFDEANISSYPLHLYNYPHDNRVSVMKAHVAEKDVLVLFGHGNPGSWNSNTFHPGNIIEYPWGNTVPAVFALSCLTGNYEGNEDSSVAEAMVNDGSAVYIGSTQITELWSGEWAVKKFVRHWTRNPGLTFGQALNRLKRDAFAYDGVFDHGKLLAFSYNLYGDPKYAPSPNNKVSDQQVVFSLNTRIAAVDEAVGTQDLVVSLPDFTIDTREGQGFVEIPGGTWLFEEGSYLVPAVIIELDIPSGSWVQDVSLHSRSNMETATNIVLPRLMSTPFCEGCFGELLPPPPPGWTPDLNQHFSWHVENKPERGSRLFLTIYPFYYNGETMDALYYKDWSFTIGTFETGVKINGLISNPVNYPLNSSVPFELWFENRGAPQDLFVSAEIRRRVSGELVEGLPLRLIEGVSGPASMFISWDSTGMQAGGYYLDVQIFNPDGMVMDAVTREFDLGIVSAEVTRLDYSPFVFTSGINEQINWQIWNNGELPVDGEAVLEISSVADAAQILLVTHPISGLAPGEVVNYFDIWETAGDTESAYSIKAYVRYFGETSEPVVRVIFDRVELFLPLIRK